MPSGFLIDGKEYFVPTLDSFDFDEAQIMYDHSGVVLEDFAPLPLDSTLEEKQASLAEQERIFRNPAFKRALALIAYRRENRDALDAEEKVGRANILDVTIALLGGSDDDPPDPSSPRSLSESSERRTSTKLEDSGEPGEIDSRTPDLIPEPIGTTA